MEPEDHSVAVVGTDPFTPHFLLTFTDAFTAPSKTSGGAGGCRLEPL
jgi:hypothetical protein